MGLQDFNRLIAEVKSNQEEGKPVVSEQELQQRTDEDLFVEAGVEPRLANTLGGAPLVYILRGSQE